MRSQVGVMSVKRRIVAFFSCMHAHDGCKVEEASNNMRRAFRFLFCSGAGSGNWNAAKTIHRSAQAAGMVLGSKMATSDAK